MRFGLPAVLVLVALAAATRPAAAIQEFTPEPGWRYEVTGVTPPDVLNVREQPGVEAGVVATLPPDAGDIAVTGVRAEVDGSVWWRILTPDGQGWVNARFLQPTDPGSEEETGWPLTCAGTEPFWSLSVSPGGEARLSTPDTEAAAWSAGPAITAAGTRGMISVRLEADGSVGHLAVIRDYDFCSDGMSDFMHPFHGLVAGPDGEVRAGCCWRGG